MPQLNRVVQRGLVLVQEAAQAACLEALDLFLDVQTPATSALWAGVFFWVNVAPNRSATEANPGRKPLHGLFYAVQSPLVLLPFVKPGFRHQHRDNTSAPEAESYLLSQREEQPPVLFFQGASLVWEARIRVRRDVGSPSGSFRAA